MLDGLIAMGIVTHVHDLHLAYLVDGIAVIAVVKVRRHSKYRVQHLAESLLSAHQVNQALRIVEHAPGVMPAVALGEGVTPFQRAEGRLERPVLEPAAHEFGFGIKHVAVVHRPLGIDLDFTLGLAQCLAQAVDAPVVVGILQRPGHTLVDTDIVGDVTQFVVILVA